MFNPSDRNAMFCDEKDKTQTPLLLLLMDFDFYQCHVNATTSDISVNIVLQTEQVAQLYLTAFQLV